MIQARKAGKRGTLYSYLNQVTPFFPLCPSTSLYSPPPVQYTLSPIPILPISKYTGHLKDNEAGLFPVWAGKMCPNFRTKPRRILHDWAITRNNRLCFLAPQTPFRFFMCRRVGPPQSAWNGRGVMTVPSGTGVEAGEFSSSYNAFSLSWGRCPFLPSHSPIHSNAASYSSIHRATFIRFWIIVILFVERKQFT